jgi:hypothetical protein
MSMAMHTHVSKSQVQVQVAARTNAPEPEPLRSQWFQLIITGKLHTKLYMYKFDGETCLLKRGLVACIFW